MKLRSSLGALGICGDSSEQTIAICQCSICRARRSGVPIRGESGSRHDGHSLRCQLYQSNRTDSNLIPVRRVVFMLELPYSSKVGITYSERNGLMLLGSS